MIQGQTVEVIDKWRQEGEERIFGVVDHVYLNTVAVEIPGRPGQPMLYFYNEVVEGLAMSDAADVVDRIDWYVRCLEDVQDGRVVRGLAEAKAGYDSARDELNLLLGEHTAKTERAERLLRRIVDPGASWNIECGTESQRLLHYLKSEGVTPGSSS